MLKCIELNSKKGKTVKFTKCQFLEDIFINYVTPLEYSCGFYFTQGLDKKDLSKLYGAIASRLEHLLCNRFVLVDPGSKLPCGYFLSFPFHNQITV